MDIVSTVSHPVPQVTVVTWSTLFTVKSCIRVCIMHASGDVYHLQEVDDRIVNCFTAAFKS